MKKLLIIAIIIICSLNTSNAQSISKTWMLVQFQDFKKEEFVALKAQMDFTNLEQPNAKMGCNTIGFQVKIKKNKIKFSKIFRTMMFCENMMFIETAFSDAIKSVKTYKLDDHKLTLFYDKNETMVFIAQDWD